MSDVKITVLRNASYMIEGPITIVDPDGNVFKLDDGANFICRCGHSSTKPFCDGSHKSVGFKADTKAPVE